MKKILVLFIILLFITQCGKKDSKKIEEENEINEELPNLDNQKSLNFEGMKSIIANSKNIDMNVFFAIAVLHKHHISQYIDQVERLPENEQQKFFEEKNKEFFNSIKYTEDEYRKFMEQNIEELNEYQNSHPAIRDYLTTM